MFSPEFQILLCACRADSTREGTTEARRIIEENQVDWEDLYKRADFHSIKPQMLDLSEKLPSSLVPSQSRQNLRDMVRSNLARQLSYEVEFFQIRDWLDKEGITVIPYKGFWLGEEMYGDPARRESTDMDLFIYRPDLERIKSIMTGRGYIAQETLANLTDEYIFGQLAEYNFDNYSGETCISHIEFHWRSSMTFYLMNIGLEDLRSQIITGRIRDHELQAFSPAANLLLAVMHHGGKECFVRLKQILDIAHIIRKYPDYDNDWLFHQAERFHVSSLLFLGIRLASELTGVSVPPAFAKHAGKRRITRMMRSRIRLMARPVSELNTYNEKLASWFFKIRSRDGLGTKAQLWRYTLRKIVAPQLVPVQLRHLFFNRKILKNPAA
jgi:hypothetical protein